MIQICETDFFLTAQRKQMIRYLWPTFFPSFTFFSVLISVTSFSFSRLYISKHTYLTFLFKVKIVKNINQIMLISVRALRACSLYRTSTSLLPLSNVVQQKAVQRSFLTDGANVIGSTPDRNSPDFKVYVSLEIFGTMYLIRMIMGQKYH